jgi:hypothetical protein
MVDLATGNAQEPPPLCDKRVKARGHGTIHRFGRQGGRRESLRRGLVVVRSLASRAALVGGYPIPHFKQAKPISLSL